MSASPEIHTEPILPNRRQLEPILAAINRYDLLELRVLLGELGFSSDAADQLIDDQPAIDLLESKIIYLKNQEIKKIADTVYPHLMEEIVNNNISLFYRLLMSTQPQVLDRITKLYPLMPASARTSLGSFADWYRNGYPRGHFRSYTIDSPITTATSVGEALSYSVEAAKYGHIDNVRKILSVLQTQSPDLIDTAVAQILFIAADNDRTDLFLEFFGLYKTNENYPLRDYLKRFNLNGNHLVVDFLIERGVDKSGLVGAAGSGDSDLLARFMTYLGVAPIHKALSLCIEGMNCAIEYGRIHAFEVLFDFYEVSGFPRQYDVLYETIRLTVVHDRLDIFKLLMNFSQIPSFPAGNLVYFMSQYDRANFLQFGPGKLLDWEIELVKALATYVTFMDSHTMVRLKYETAGLVLNHPSYRLSYKELFKEVIKDIDSGWLAPEVLMLFLIHAPDILPGRTYTELSWRIKNGRAQTQYAPDVIATINITLLRKMSESDISRFHYYDIPTWWRDMALTRDPRFVNLILRHIFPLYNPQRLELFDLAMESGVPVEQATFHAIVAKCDTWQGVKNVPQLISLVYANPHIQDLDNLPALAMRWNDEKLLQMIEVTTVPRGNYNGMLESAAYQGNVRYLQLALDRGATTIKAAKNAARKHGQEHIWAILEERYPKVHTTWPKVR